MLNKIKTNLCYMEIVVFIVADNYLLKVSISIYKIHFRWQMMNMVQNIGVVK
jgi:hypothetical protein